VLYYRQIPTQLYIVAVIPIYVLLMSVTGDSTYTVKDKEPDTKTIWTYQGEDGMEIRTYLRRKSTSQAQVMRSCEETLSFTNLFKLVDFLPRVTTSLFRPTAFKQRSGTLFLNAASVNESSKEHILICNCNSNINFTT
jgi:hypothetical protein